MTDSQRNKLMTIFDQILTQKNLFEHTRLPITMSDINRFYLTGINSIKSNIPHPHVFIKDGHACVSLREVIAHQLAHGMEFDNISTQIHKSSDEGNSIVTSNAAKCIFDSIDENEKNTSNILLLYVMFWSDDFEVSHIKNEVRFG